VSLSRYSQDTLRGIASHIDFDVRAQLVLRGEALEQGRELAFLLLRHLAGLRQVTDGDEDDARTERSCEILRHHDGSF
jgi:hypothetical protein